MPSQDLSAWIQGSTSSLPSLPPLKNPSPLSLGEIVKNAFDWSKHWLINSACTWLTTVLSSSASPSTSSSSPSRGEQENKKIPLRVDTDDPDDPDILVLGFQELDLSTEALIYYTSTVREDAWCHAIFAALGEKAIKYEKASSNISCVSVLCNWYPSKVSLKATCWNAHRSISEKVTEESFWKCENLCSWLGNSWSHGTIKDLSEIIDNWSQLFASGKQRRYCHPSLLHPSCKVSFWKGSVHCRLPYPDDPHIRQCTPCGVRRNGGEA